MINNDYEGLVELVSKIVKEKIAESNLLNISSGEYSIPVGVSNHHIHVSREVLDILYGKGYELTPLKDLSQPGQYAAKETVTIVGPKMRAIQNVRILGPIRGATQVELSKTDGIYLGINLPTRMSGDIKGSAPVTVVGPRGSVHLSEGAIRAMRHIHMHPTDADRFQVRDKEIVDIEIPGESGIILKNVTIRVNEEYRLELHIDTDEGNAANISTGAFCKIIK